VPALANFFSTVIANYPRCALEEIYGIQKFVGHLMILHMHKFALQIAGIVCENIVNKFDEHNFLKETLFGIF
jgi:hypothetical protein